MSSQNGENDGVGHPQRRDGAYLFTQIFGQTLANGEDFSIFLAYPLAIATTNPHWSSDVEVADIVPVKLEPEAREAIYNDVSRQFKKVRHPGYLGCWFGQSADYQP